jgi:glutathione S-transferase
MRCCVLVACARSARVTRVARYETLQAQTPEKQEEGKKNLLAAIKAISAAYERSGGPFFFGAKPSYADFHWFPWAHRIGVLQHYRGFSVPQSPEFAGNHHLNFPPFIFFSAHTLHS